LRPIQNIITCSRSFRHSMAMISMKALEKLGTTIILKFLVRPNNTRPGYCML
jgi:hypothetical protein